MRSLRRGAASALLVLAVAGCTDDAAGPAPTSSKSTSSASGTTDADLAGGAEAEALAPLPAGPATGTAVLVYSGLGELRAPFTGQCSHEGSTTRIEGSADTARIVLDVTPDGARLALDDDGVTATSDLSTGRYEVTGSHLSLRADMSQDGESAGSAELEIDCGG
ncbi:hypothetical protein SAMN05660662_2203 [Blastococcus aurantiacus]|uniref:Lipoprotein antigen n=1 Tax=Blastococcus aurantiacus TaxID=1550231 RepID=A0A1G7L181_9ACTN|nr:hypothetical protein [Blastococcus aurantiacus]SDF43267.1 hypothetical protein SAMN05660662_2203 [Blastococcus aurantiacus]